MTEDFKSRSKNSRNVLNSFTTNHSSPRNDQLNEIIVDSKKCSEPTYPDNQSVKGINSRNDFFRKKQAWRPSLKETTPIIEVTSKSSNI